MRAVRVVPFAVLVVLLSASSARAYQASQGPTELLLWDPAQAYEGYTLFAAHGKTYLIDLSGNLVHQWNLGTNPKLLPNGHVLDATKDDPSGFGGFQEVDWDGNVVWEYKEARASHAPHHDFVRIHNPKLGAETTMYIANVTVTNAQALAAGANPATAPKDADGAQVDAIVEVDMNGNVIWEWWFLDHLVQDDNAAWPNYVGAGKTVADAPGRLDVNLPGRPLRRDWLHCNSMDYNETLDQVVINAVGGEFYVIDHGGTFLPGDPAGSIALAASAKGDFLYRFGDPARYDQGDPPSIPDNWTTVNSGHKQIGGSHDIHWIAPGLPGEGHFLVFNNGQYLFEQTNQSYADEIDPYLGANGTGQAAYVNPPDAGYTVFEPDKDTHKPKKNLSKQLVWRYGTLSPSGMASHIGGSAQRLPNGNTLICADTEGHLMEVTSDGTLVWEYISPVTKEGMWKVMPDSLPMTNSLFRAYRFGLDDPAFVGRDLTPQGPLTDQGPPQTPDPEPDAGADVVQPDAGVDPGATAEAGPDLSSDAKGAEASVDTAGPDTTSGDTGEASCGTGQAECDCPSSGGCTLAGWGGGRPAGWVALMLSMLGLCCVGGRATRSMLPRAQRWR